MREALDTALLNLSSGISDTQANITCGALPAVIADKSQIVQVWQNLIGNALKFRGEATPEIHIDAQDSGNEWTFSVKDNGIGIDPAYKERIFLIFQRLHSREEYPGSGIGLSICKRIIERHSGRIWVDSEPGKGATLYFTLPKHVKEGKDK